MSGDERESGPNGNGEGPKGPDGSDRREGDDGRNAGPGEPGGPDRAGDGETGSPEPDKPGDSEDPGPKRPEPIFNALPPALTALILILIGIEVTIFLGENGILDSVMPMASFGWRQDWILRFGFLPQEFMKMAAIGQWRIETLGSMVSYPFVHRGFSQVLFVGILLLAMGKMVSGVFGQFQMMIVFFASSIGGALAYAIAEPAAGLLVGGFPGVFGLVGGFTYLIWLRLERTGGQVVRAFTLVAVLIGLQLLFGLVFEVEPTWTANVAGCATGFVLSFVLLPGGWTRLLELLRRR